MLSGKGVGLGVGPVLSEGVADRLFPEADVPTDQIVPQMQAKSAMNPIR